MLRNWNFKLKFSRKGWKKNLIWRRRKFKNSKITKKLKLIINRKYCLKIRFSIWIVSWKDETASITVKYNFLIKWKNSTILINLYWLSKWN